MAPWPRAPVIPHLVDCKNFRDNRWIVRVQYFVRGGFVGHRFRASSKHLYSHLPVDGVRFLGGQKGLRCSCKMHVWVSGSPKISTAAGSGYVTALALSYRTFLLRKV
ncbi:hypothetical protein TNCV_5141931 [Trichonephila clavipes]|nr:hypothetical protein TNCV_5141931 [Trichonephila clavipes]